MFRKSSKITVRSSVVAVIGCLVCAVSPLPAQLRFSAPSNQADITVATPRENPVRNDQPIRQAQFRPIESGSAPSAQLPPPGKTELSTDLPPSPPQPDAPSVHQLVTEPETIEMADPMMGMGEEMIISDGAPFGQFEQDFIDEGAEIYSTNAWFRRGYWYSSAEVVLLLRTGAEHVPITADNSIGVEESNMLSTAEVDPTYVPGARLTLGRFLGQDVSNRDHMLEINFLGLFEYRETASIVATGIEPTFGLPGLETALGPGAVFVNTTTLVDGVPVTNGINGRVTGPPVPGFSFARRNDIRYDSDFNSFEVNYRISSRPNHDRVALQPNGAWVRHATATRLFTAIAGVRAISVNELFRLQATFEDNIASGTYQVQTNNDMYGPQLGFEVAENYGRWSGGIRFKGGALYNFADRRSKRHTVFNGVDDLRDQHVSGENLVAMLQGGLVAAYEVQPNLVARIAYDAMYLQGFATAGQNLGLEINFPEFEVTGDAIFHGLSIGLDYMW